MKTRLLFLVACLPALALSAVIAAPAPTETGRFDWPQWRGPERNDISKENDLLKQWPTAGPTLLWTSEEAGNGYSGPAVVGDHLYTMGADEKSEFLICLNVADGKKVWRHDYGQRFNNAPWGDGPRGTPTVEGEVLYAIGGQGDLVCAKLADGISVWEKSLTKDLGGKRPGWGYTESPLIDGEKLVVTPGGGKGTVAALNKKTGDVIWRSKGFTDGAQYSSLVVGNCGGIKQYVQMTAQSVAGVAADDGRLLWRFECKNPTAAIPTPIVDGDYVYSTSGYGAGCRLVKITADGGKEKEKAEEVYANKDMTNHHGGVVKVGDYLYGYSDNGGAWVCQEFKTGKVVWPTNDKAAKPEQKKDIQKLGKGSLTCAGGMLYLYSEGKGECALIEASPEGWREHGRFTIPKTAKKPGGAGIRTHPVVANGKLYLRDQELIYAFDVSAKAAGR